MSAVTSEDIVAEGCCQSGYTDVLGHALVEASIRSRGTVARQAGVGVRWKWFSVPLLADLILPSIVSIRPAVQMWRLVRYG